MSLRSKWVGNLLRFFNGTTDILDVDGANGAVDVKQAGGLKYAGTAVTATATELNRAADVSGRIVNLTAATLSLTEATHDGKVVTVNRAAGSTLTLPAAAGSGASFRVIVGTTVTSNTLIVQVANASDAMTGTALLAQDGGDTSVMFETAATDDTITMNGSTTGGIKGDCIELIDVAANVWWVRVTGSATGTEATPFSAAV